MLPFLGPDSLFRYIALLYLQVETDVMVEEVSLDRKVLLDQEVFRLKLSICFLDCRLLICMVEYNYIT